MHRARAAVLCAATATGAPDHRIFFTAAPHGIPRPTEHPQQHGSSSSDRERRGRTRERGRTA
ncbi:hypothetical protein KPATCC21470_4564 [Kitasatospora purpeofusca]